MSAKGYITGNDAADRILRDEVPCSEPALCRVIAAERNRTIASLRARIGRTTECSHEVLAILDEMEQSA